MHGVKIDFKPTHQVLHGPKPLIVKINDPNGIPLNPRLIVRYDGLDVTHSFMGQAQKLSRSSSGELVIRVPVIRLSPNVDHRIEIRYYDKKGKPSWSYYKPPVCRAFDSKPVRHTDGFTPDTFLLDLIGVLSERSQINPALTTALIAQESSFNPRTVSWAKAIGLTQVTPIAEDQIAGQIPDYQGWPRYKGIDRIPASMVRMMVLTGRINEHNDWKLDKMLSIRGGLAYLSFLQKHWNAPERASRYDEVERTRLILASYNSGLARVTSAVHEYGSRWLQAPELREARKYVNQIFSYCDFFSQDQLTGEDSPGHMTEVEVDNENET